MTWLYKDEKFFTLYNTPDGQKVSIASIHFEGKVLPWFQLQEKVHQVADWPSLSTAIQIQFGPSQFDNRRSDLFKLKQSSTVTDYYASFTELVNQSYALDDSVLLDCFISGLIPELKREVISQAPHSLLRLCHLINSSRKNFYPSSLAPKHKFAYFPAKSLTQNISKLSLTTNTNPPLNTNQPPLLPTPLKPNNLKRLTPASIQFRREKRICFTCDEKYSPIHRCANKHSFLLQCEDEIPSEPDPNVQSQQIIQNQSEKFDQTPHLSYNAMRRYHGERHD